MNKIKTLKDMANKSTLPRSSSNCGCSCKPDFWINKITYHWMYGDKDTGIDSRGKPGETPKIGPNKNWWIGGVDTGHSSIGADGNTPYVGLNDNWWIDGEDTGHYSKGGNGHTPYIGLNDNWWINGEDTGKKAVPADAVLPPNLITKDPTSPVNVTTMWTGEELAFDNIPAKSVQTVYLII